MARTTQLSSAPTNQTRQRFRHLFRSVLSALARLARGFVRILSVFGDVILFPTRYRQIMDAQTIEQVDTQLHDGRKEVAFYESLLVPLAIKVAAGRELILDASAGLVSFIICQLVSFLLAIPTAKCLFVARTERSHFIALGAIIQKLPAISVLGLLLYLAATQLSAGATIAFGVVIALIVLLLIVTWFRIDLVIGGAILDTWAAMCRSCLGADTDDGDEEYEINTATSVTEDRAATQPLAASPC